MLSAGRRRLADDSFPHTQYTRIVVRDAQMLHLFPRHLKRIEQPTQPELRVRRCGARIVTGIVRQIDLRPRFIVQIAVQTRQHHDPLRQVGNGFQ